MQRRSAVPPHQHDRERSHLRGLAVRAPPRLVRPSPQCHLGLLPGGAARRPMKFGTSRFFTALPYLGLALALVLSTWAFVRSDRYRQETDEILNQTYEIQWRATQVRERLVRVHGYIRLADEAGKLDPDTDRQMALVSVNIAQLLALPYLQHFFPQKDVELLENVRRTIEQNVAPVVEAGSNYRQALDHMTDLEQDMYEISSATVDHSITLQETAQIDIAASRNWFMFAIALGLAAIFYLVTHQRHAYVSRRDQHIRSFASLFAHMTRSRVTALRLFLENTGFEHPPREEMLKAARGAANELESINDGLLKIAFAQRDSHVLPLAKLLLDLKDRSGIVQLSVDSKAGTQLVPATQFQLVLGELVQNALTAVETTDRPCVLVKASVLHRPIFRRNILFLEVADNGVGMTPEILRKAKTPFFSTKAGNHVGLGLTGCSQMVATLNGKLFIDSKPGAGTVVRVRIPLRAYRL
ncbi:MAG: ATP-binding protein [Mesorhizobium sp.]|nr:MAG: ATP-binding protein [Mesorhizobium sp.]RWL95420.1 MAG: ATP-binding protein [Mesorhizobium sp.]